MKLINNKAIYVILKFNDKVRPILKAGKNKKINPCAIRYTFHEGLELTLNTFKSGLFSSKTSLGKVYHSDLAKPHKILSYKNLFIS